MTKAEIITKLTELKNQSYIFSQEDRSQLSKNPSHDLIKEFHTGALTAYQTAIKLVEQLVELSNDNLIAIIDRLTKIIEKEIV